MEKLFGTDGIRGLVGDNLINKNFAYRLGRAMIRFCQEKKLPLKIALGRDTRFSGQELLESAGSAILDSGGQAVSAGIITTPGLSYITKKEGFGLGLMITASHNGAGFNGYKFFLDNGEKLSSSDEELMEKLILAEDEKSFDFRLIAEEPFYKEKYKNFLLSSFGKKSLNKNIILDCANGAVFEIAPEVFKKICQAKAIHSNPDGNNINANCGSQFTEDLCRKVMSEKADLGLAFDGDGDRLIAVDGKGRTLTGDHLLYIIGKMLKEEKILENNTIVSTVMSNLGFVRKLEENGIKHLQTGVGDTQVSEAMKKTGAILGGEESGHIIFSKYLPGGDGILSALMLLKALDYFGKPLSVLANEVFLFPKVLINFEVKKKPPLEGLEKVTRLIEDIEKKLGSNGRVLVRYSGTEPKCRVMVEGRDKEQVELYANKIANEIKNSIS